MNEQDELRDELPEPPPNALIMRVKIEKIDDEDDENEEISSADSYLD